MIGDTGFFVGLQSRTDADHDKCVAALRTLHEPVITTWPVLTETCHLLSHRVHPDARLAFLSTIHPAALRIYPLGDEHLGRFAELIHQYRDVKMDFADASLVVLAEELKSGEILTLDSDFKFYRWGGKQPFHNLL